MCANFLKIISKELVSRLLLNVASPYTDRSSRAERLGRERETRKNGTVLRERRDGKMMGRREREKERERGKERKKGRRNEGGRTRVGGREREGGLK